MQAYKFETMVQKNGIIQIPEIARLAHQRVEVFVVVRPDIEQETEKLQAVEIFLDKWQGFLKGLDPDELKSQYLQEKYEGFDRHEYHS
jgi:hypothetical protein